MSEQKSTQTSSEKPVITEPLTEYDQKAKTQALIAYGIMVLGFFFMVPWIVGAVWAMAKKSDAVGSRFEDHYSNMAFTFWVSLVLFVIGYATVILIVGYLVLIGTFIWCVYRIVKGLARITSDKPYSA